MGFACALLNASHFSLAPTAELWADMHLFSRKAPEPANPPSAPSAPSTRIKNNPSNPSSVRIKNNPSNPSSVRIKNNNQSDSHGHGHGHGNSHKTNNDDHKSAARRHYKPLVPRVSLTDAPAAKNVGQFSIGKTLGHGTFGEVKLAIHMPTGEQVAVKILEKSKVKEKADVRRVNREIKILKKARHSNIIQLFEVLDTPKNIYLMMENCEGGEMFDYIVAHKVPSPLSPSSLSPSFHLHEQPHQLAPAGRGEDRLGHAPARHRLDGSLHPLSHAGARLGRRRGAAALAQSGCSSAPDAAVAGGSVR